jgi:Flp pilus assembly protein TadB
MTAWLLGGATALITAAVLAPAATRPRTRARRRSLPPAARAAPAVVGVAVLLVLTPPLVLVVAAAWPVVRVARRRRSARAHASAVRRALPDLVDLLRLATTAGMTLAVAHPVVAPHVSAPIGPALAGADVAARRGRPRADAIVEALQPFGDRAQVLAHLLGDHLRYGVPLLPGLERTGLELRLDRRRAAELDARRVPVRLLGPLVTCVLPAFALLTVVPLLAASLEALPL